MPNGLMRAARCRHDADAARIRAQQVLKVRTRETLRANLRAAADVAEDAAAHGVVSEEEARMLRESAAKARLVTEAECDRPVSPGAAARVAEASARLERALRIVREDAEARNAEEQRMLTSQRRAEKKERRRARRERERQEAAGEAVRAALQRKMDEDQAQLQAMAEEREQHLRALQEQLQENGLMMGERFDFSCMPEPHENNDDIHDAIEFLVDTYNQTVHHEPEVVDRTDALERAAARARQAAHELQQDDLLACQELEEALRESEDEYARVLEAEAREEWASNHNNVSNYGECVVCLSERATHAVVPCGHMIVCGACAGQARLEQCPMCRGAVAQLMRVFLA